MTSPLPILARRSTSPGPSTLDRSNPTPPSIGATLLSLLRRQWQALGTTDKPGRPADWCVDPEALILIMTTQGRRDPALFDAMLDWLWVHGQSVNVQRLKNIHRTLELGDRAVLAAIAGWLCRRTAQTKWKPLAQGNLAPNRHALLFPAVAPTSPADSDPVFGRYGWDRPLKVIRPVGSPDSGQAGALLWKLRAVFGVQARAEVVLRLLTVASAHSAEIARATFYFPRTIDDTIAELAASGMVRTARVGRQKRCWIRPEDWTFLRTWTQPAGFPRWVDWARLFKVSERLAQACEDPTASEEPRASRLTPAAHDLRPLVDAAGLLREIDPQRPNFDEALRRVLLREATIVASA